MYPTPPPNKYPALSLDELIRIREALERAHPAEPQSRLRRAGHAFATVLKYIGIPALIIAAISPTTGLLDHLREARNRHVLQGAYLSYCRSLLQQGAPERAAAMMQDLDLAEKRALPAQFMIAKAAAMQAIKQGKRYQEATDRILLLLHMHRAGGWLFPSMGEPYDIVELELALVDIEVEFGTAARAAAALHALTARRVLPDRRALFEGELLLRRGKISTALEQRDAPSLLQQAYKKLSEARRDDLLAEALFHLGKAYQHAGANDEALAEYARAVAAYIRLDDRFGLGKTYNNIGLVYLQRKDYSRADQLFELYQQTALETGDEVGVARATLNRSTVALYMDAPEKALGPALAAQTAFTSLHNWPGLAGANYTLSIIYEQMGDTSQALRYAEQSARALEAVHSLPNLAIAHARICELACKLHDISRAVRSQLIRIMLLAQVRSPGLGGDVERLRNIAPRETLDRELLQVSSQVRALLEWLDVPWSDAALTATDTHQ